MYFMTYVFVTKNKFLLPLFFLVYASFGSFNSLHVFKKNAYAMSQI